MKSSVRAIVLAVVISLYLPGFSGQTSAADLVGIVTDSVTGQPMEGVSVTLLEADITETTDAAGAYSFLDLPDGTYSLLVGQTDYKPKIVPLVSVGIVCGDANGDGSQNISDAVFIVGWIFKGGSAPPNLLAADANCDSTNNVSDAVRIINWIFKGGTPPCCP